MATARDCQVIDHCSCQAPETTTFSPLATLLLRNIVFLLGDPSCPQDLTYYRLTMRRAPARRVIQFLES
jgi:hypothetical protein